LAELFIKYVTWLGFNQLEYGISTDHVIIYYCYMISKKIFYSNSHSLHISPSAFDLEAIMWDFRAINIPEMEPGLNLWPVARPDPTRTLLTRWPDPVTECLCFELRDYIDDGVLLVKAFCQKSLVYAAHIQITKISSMIIIVNLLSIEK